MVRLCFTLRHAVRFFVISLVFIFSAYVLRRRIQSLLGENTHAVFGGLSSNDSNFGNHVILRDNFALRENNNLSGTSLVPSNKTSVSPKYTPIKI